MDLAPGRVAERVLLSFAMSYVDGTSQVVHRVVDLAEGGRLVTVRR